MRHLQDTEDLLGITWWCSHDVSRDLDDFPELEYDLGLIDEHSRIKPEGFAVRDAIAAARTARRAAVPTPELILPAAAMADRSLLAPGSTFFDDYMALARSQGHPRIVLG